MEYLTCVIIFSVLNDDYAKIRYIKAKISENCIHVLWEAEMITGTCNEKHPISGSFYNCGPAF